MHARQKGEDGRAQVDALLDAARGSADAPVLGVLPKARAAPLTPETLKLHRVTTGVDALLDAARGSADAPVLGVLPKARAAPLTPKTLKST